MRLPQTKPVQLVDASVGVASRPPRIYASRSETERCAVTRQELLKRLDVLIDQMKQDRAYGQIAIAFRDGEADYIRKETTEKLGAQGTTHAKNSYR